MNHIYGWQGKRVRNADGRTGTIAIEDGFAHLVDLHIQCDDGSRSKVTLNARGSDTGDSGWQWWCPEFAGKSAWLPLGEQGAPLIYAEDTQHRSCAARSVRTDAELCPDR